MIATSTIQAYKDDTERDREGSSILGFFFFNLTCLCYSTCKNTQVFVLFPGTNSISSTLVFVCFCLPAQPSNSMMSPLEFVPGPAHDPLRGRISRIHLGKFHIKSLRNL